MNQVKILNTISEVEKECWDKLRTITYSCVMTAENI